MVRRSFLVLALTLLTSFAASGIGATAAPRVVVTIKPVHSLVAGIMGKAGEPELLWAGAESPHHSALRPSQRHAIEQAEVVVYAGASLEAGLVELLDARKQAGAETIALTGIASLTRLPMRSGGAWGDGHGHGANGSDDAHSDGHGDEHAEAIDPHVWLDPQNAKAITLHIAETLARLDPANALTYRENAAGMIIQLNALGREIATMLAPVRDKPYVVFHDAYQYFEKRFGLNGAGAITIGPDRAPGARRLSEVRHAIIDSGARCVFAEPQFEVGYIATVAEGTSARSAILDPLGSALPAGKEAYAALMWAMAKAFVDCLQPDASGQ